MYVAKVLSNNMIVGITWKQEKKLLKNESKFILLFTMFGVPGNFLSMNLPPKSWTTLEPSNVWIDDEEKNWNLSSEKSEDAEKEEEENEKGGDGFNRGDQRLEQVLQRLPVSSHLDIGSVSIRHGSHLAW